ncbi:MAG: glutathione S-transferase family protein [Rhodobacteraceae bacterium]|nr:glutathione S-transferase family protein [Paracoccaceae bacterium]
MILHHCHQARSVRSLWLLYELDVPFTLVMHDFGKELRSEAYLSKHPLGRVPCLEIDGRVLFETGAITEYLCEIFDSTLGRRSGDPERREWLQWLHYAETVAVHGASLTQQHIVIYEDKDRSQMVMKLESRRLEKTLEVLNDHLEGREFLLRDFSAVDISVGYSVFVAQHFVKIGKFKNLTAWMSRLHKREGFVKSLIPNGKSAIYQDKFYGNQA